MTEMKKFNLTIVLYAILSVIIFTACEPQNQQKQPKEYITKKIVKAKNQSEETTYGYKYNLWKGNFYHQPDIHSVYYIVYTDGSYDKVDVGKFTITNIGDTIIEKHYR